MGLFGNRNAGSQNAAQLAAQQVADLQAGLTEGSYDPNDPAFAPVEGVDLETYCKAVAAIQNAGATTPEEAAKVAAGVGVPAEKWQAVSDGWVARMRSSRAVMNRYGMLYGTV